jgi:hypothetical protein
VTEPVQRAAIANAPTFVDLLEDPAGDALDAPAVVAFPGRRLITYGDAGPAGTRTSRGPGRSAPAGPGGASRARATRRTTPPEEFAAVISLFG